LEKIFEGAGMIEIEGEREEEEEQQTLGSLVGSNEQEENRHVEEVQSTPMILVRCIWYCELDK
jgi:hypothetical protein